MDYFQKVTEKQAEMADLYERMDTDRNLLYLKKYILKDSKNQAVPDIVNVTLNKPAIFAGNIITALGATSQQSIVQSNNPKIDTHYIEEFHNALLNAANYRLRKMGQASLNSFADTQLCIRGRAARRVLVRMKDGKLVSDITSWDARYTTYERGDNGLKWGGYSTTRSKDLIFAEYGIEVPNKKAKVLDVWDTEINEVWIDEKKEWEEPHNYGECPIVLEVVPLGYGNILMDDQRLVYEGESIFFLVRDIIPELNRLVSILQTLNMKAIKVAMQFKNKEGKTAVPPDYDEATASGSMTSVDLEGGIFPITYGDAQRSAQMVYQMMEKAMQEGSVTSTDLGNLQFPLSAVALVEIGEGRDQVYLPRLQGKALLNQDTIDMATRQLLKIGGKVKLGTPGRERVFDTEKLEGEYETTYKYFVKSPKTDIARMSVAKASEAYYDTETILSDVLQVEDPKGIMRKRYYDMAEKIDPNILRHRIIMSMLDMAENGDDNAAMQAQIMTLGMGMSLEQVKRGEIPEPPKSEESPKPMLPLLGEGQDIRGMRPGKRAVEEQMTPQEAS